MIELVDSSKVEPIDKIMESYPSAKVLLLDVDASDISHVKGAVYKVSRSADEFDALCVEQDNLIRQGKSAMIVGSYSDWGDVGVQYEVNS